MTTATWMGINEATDADHDECYCRYCAGCPDLACYHFAVADDLSSAEVVSTERNPEAANGIWTLAEIRASGEDWPRVAAVAAMMRAAVRREMETV